MYASFHTCESALRLVKFGTKLYGESGINGITSRLTTVDHIGL